MPDGTVKQVNPLTGTQVWTIPGRGHRPLTVPDRIPQPIEDGAEKTACAFCSGRMLETPPEKARVVRDVNVHGDVSWRTLPGQLPQDLGKTVADFRRVPNLFEIVSYNYWHLGHGLEPSEEQRRAMAEYLATPGGYDHILSIVRNKLKASGSSEADLEQISEPELLRAAYGFFCGGHDLIIGRRHFVDGATDDSQLAGAGTLTPNEHEQFIRFTIESMKQLYGLHKDVRYVAAFQNWLRPAGASFDHLHKQLVAIDERPVQIEAELSRLRKNPQIYSQILAYTASRGLVLAQNDHAVALAGFGHRFPSVAVWPLGQAATPWECTPEQVRGVSDLLQAMHAATGVEVPCNEEWYHCPPSQSGKVNMRWRILLKWRISTLAGFEGGTRIYLNTLDPWVIRDRVTEKLLELRENSEKPEEQRDPNLPLIAPMRIGKECKVTPEMLG
ncbi:DUF4921 domain-containing protein [Boudabousia tangfeifanii]|uniref:DUF4921 domain-containing protein n=1 Tax=Boudabousia tangfeifanii TaxID=1912795 RepID=A0A1D9MMP2_9ACTO|nr:DUF4921 family protein [Boudabousia tangfeifanii]AOZ73576.1 DUF4921 domain-containing protein [Boudabousia tangfeifanii]